MDSVNETKRFFVGMNSTSRMETGMEILPFSINYLPKFAIRICEEECKETPERKINSIHELRSLLLRKWDPKVLPFQHFKQFVVMLSMQLLRHPLSQITGFKIIHDVQDLSLRHLRYCTPQNVYILYHALLNCFPARFKAFHVIYESPPMKVVWNLVKPFLSEKMRNRVHFHNNCEELLDVFPSCIIPTKYGGKLQESFDIMEFLRNANNY
ncbi:unnamed protein product [Larinioides sclopetarius]|uniref:CRAL-TRIO domain-containing protein n=1 Tax=Larinioides sclopetarius TaxID=280406 RepID=A0AAV2BS12_9ARAC